MVVMFYGEYAKTNNLVAVAIYMFCLLAAQTAQIGMWLPPASVASASLHVSTGTRAVAVIV